MDFNWYWYRDPWILTGIGTEYRHFGTVTKLIETLLCFTRNLIFCLVHLISLVFYLICVCVFVILLVIVVVVF